jgi:putative Mn2+ efflux pump MntP
MNCGLYGIDKRERIPGRELIVGPSDQEIPTRQPRIQRQHCICGEYGPGWMSISALILLALSVSTDNFAVSLALGMSQRARIARPALRLSFTFGLCQFLMPLLGWLGGSRVAFLFRGHERWPLFVSLIFVGWRMLRSADTSDKARQSDVESLGARLSLAIATSLDSLVVGFGLAMTRVDILQASAILGAVGGALTFVGIACGKRLGHALGRYSRFAGGLTLIAIAVRALVAR